MKVLLVDPPQLFLEGTGATRQVQPLGIAYVGAAIAGDHDVRFLLPDTRSYRGQDPWGEIVAAIAAEKPDLVGITAVTATFPSAKKLAETVKAADSEIWVVLGGVHASVAPVSALQSAPAVDLAVVGEGERTVSELCAALEGVGAGERTSFEAIPGVAWRDDTGQVCLSQPRPVVDDLDTIPFALREPLVWPDDVHNAFFQAMVTQRGCPYGCIFCAVPSSDTRKVRARSPENIVAEISLLKRDHQISGVFFHDSVFTLNRKNALETCRQMRDLGGDLPFFCQTRADRVDPELIDHMVDAGCQRIMFGIESGDDDSLQRIGKSMDLKTIARAIEMVKERGVRCTGFFMVGFPWETRDLMEKTVDFAIDLGLDAVSLFSATPLPGTALWGMAKEQLMPDVVDFRTPRVNLTELSNEEYQQIFTKLRRRVDAYNQAEMYRSLERVRPSIDRYGHQQLFPAAAQKDPDKSSEDGDV